jgi:Putative rhamnosyl transferase
MLTYIITRFSIFDRNCYKFKLRRNKNKDEFFNKLFSTNRLNSKFTTFEKITLPSILNQSNKNYIWNIYTSEYLPEEYKNRLIELTSPHKKINIHYVKSFKYFDKSVDNVTKNKTFKYCTIRLDDDDGLSANFIENLQKYKNEDKTIISHPKGTRVTIKDDKLVLGKKISKLNNAQGLCGIGMNIYSCGNHMKVAEKFKVIYDNTPNMYLVNCDYHCDTKRKFVESDNTFSHLKRPFNVAGYTPKEIWDIIFY